MNREEYFKFIFAGKSHVTPSELEQVVKLAETKIGYLFYYLISLFEFIIILY